MASNYRSRQEEEGKEEEEDEEEEIDESGYKTVKDAVLFAIDISQSMLATPPESNSKKADRDSPASAALKCAYQLMQQRIISNPNDMMGILLFGTEQSRFPDDENLSYPHCYVLSDLDVPAAADVKRLKNLVEDESESAELLVPSKEPAAMGNVLFCANRIFTTRAPNFSSRRLFLVTNNDNPHVNDKALRSAAAVRAKDLYDLGVVIELFPIAKPDKGFDRTLFYDDIVYRAIPSDPEAPAPLATAAKTAKSGDGISLLQSLLSSINSKAAPRRAQFTLPFEIGPGLKIGVKGYTLIKRQEVVRSCYVWTGGEKMQIATGSTQQLAEDTARSVEKAEIRKAYTFGGEKIVFTEDEIKNARKFGDPVIRIIGFKSLEKLPVWASYRHSTFIYPSDTDYVGSTRVFSALQQNMLSKKKYALTWFVARKNATPVLAAAIPGAEVLDDEGNQLMPPGLWLISLPFADDIRQPPEVDLVRAPDTLVDLMRTVVQQLQLPKGVYDPSKYPNPQLQWFYRVLQSIALDEDIPEQAEDKTIPRHRQIDKRAGQYIIDWGQELESQYQKWSKTNRIIPMTTAPKRAAPASASADPGPKRAKTTSTTSADNILDDAAMRKHFEKNTIPKLKVAELKDWATGKKLPTAGLKKGDLVQLVEGWFEGK